MKISIEELFKNSFVITVNNEKYDFFKKVFTANDLPIPNRFDGIGFNGATDAYWGKQIPGVSKLLRNTFGCSASHQAIVRMARQMDLPFVCVFEDDAYPCIDIKNKLEYYLSEIPDNADCVVLGNYQLNSCSRYNDRYFKLGKDAVNFWGGHAYIVFKKAYDRYIEISQKIDCIADHIFIFLNNTYEPYLNLFIQYNYLPSTTTNSTGYLWKGFSLDKILKEFPKVEDLLNIDKHIQLKSNCSDLDDEKIDYVFPYCNFEDPVWNKQYMDYLNSIGQKFDNEARRRYIDNFGIIKYSLRSIDRYLPWINNVYLIVSGESQIPDWLDTGKVKIVMHDQILPKEMIPCFNSIGIEHYISRIPGLSEKFLYGNDDFLALKPLTKDMFFTDDGKLNIGIKKLRYDRSFYHDLIRNSWKLLFDKENKTVPDEFNNITYEHSNIHAFRPQLKSIRNQILNKYQVDIENTFSRIRKINNLLMIEFPYYCMNGYATDNFKLPGNFHSYTTIDNDYAYRLFQNNIEKDVYYTMVINSCNDQYAGNVKKILDKKFDFKSKYEK